MAGLCGRPLEAASAEGSTNGIWSAVLVPVLVGKVAADAAGLVSAVAAGLVSAVAAGPSDVSEPGVWPVLSVHTSTAATNTTSATAAIQMERLEDVAMWRVPVVASNSGPTAGARTNVTFSGPSNGSSIGGGAGG